MVVVFSFTTFVSGSICMHAISKIQGWLNGVGGGWFIGESTSEFDWPWFGDAVSKSLTPLRFYMR